MTHYIGVVGTHSTGKTTFMNAVDAALTTRGFNVKRVADKATDCRNVGFGILRDHTFESTLWIMSSVIRAELEMGRVADVVLVDRPVPDALGYLEAALATQGRSITPEERHYLYSLAAHHSPRYDCLFKTVLDPKVPLGPRRDNDLGFRALVDEKLNRVLEESNIKHAILAHGQVDLAVQDVLNALGTAVE